MATDEMIIRLVVMMTLLTIVFAVVFIGLLLVVDRLMKRTKEEHCHDLLKERAATMNFVSMELHDDIKQRLGTLSFMIKAVDRAPPSEKHLKPALRKLENITSDLQNLSLSLNPAYIADIGLYNALSDKLDLLTATRELQCRFDIVGQRQQFDDHTQLMIYRIAQEAIQNTLKYAGASKLSIILCIRDSCFKMYILDNGKGFDPEQIPERSSSGLMNIRHRVGLVKGTLYVLSAPGKGTRIVLRIDK